jgi:hypothetical protein
MPLEINCDVASLAAHGTDFDVLDPQQFEAAKTYLLALILKAVSEGEDDYTDWCALMNMMKQYQSLPDYKLRSAYMYLLVQTASNSGVSDADLSAESFRKAISCWCCSVKPEEMLAAEIFLLCKLLSGGNRQGD